MADQPWHGFFPQQAEIARLREQICQLEQELDAAAEREGKYVADIIRIEAERDAAIEEAAWWCAQERYSNTRQATVIDDDRDLICRRISIRLQNRVEEHPPTPPPNAPYTINIPSTELGRELRKGLNES